MKRTMTLLLLGAVPGTFLLVASDAALGVPQAKTAAQGNGPAHHAGPLLICADAVKDQDGPGCLQATSVPTPGKLFPPPHDGGFNNVASGTRAFVGSGSFNQATGSYSMIGGGFLNSASACGATVAGGYVNYAGGYYATIGGGASNQAGARATVAGGVSNLATGSFAAVGGGEGNQATHSHSSVAGGRSNQATESYAAVGGGRGNQASDGFATVGGGLDNVASHTYATVSGGQDNEATGFLGTVGGGRENLATTPFATVAGGGYNEAGGNGATVGGGTANTATGNGSTVAGGSQNLASGQASQYATDNATVGGGYVNHATGDFSTVPGGRQNLASGAYSFAAGVTAKAQHLGAFVWSGSSGLNRSSSTSDQFNVYASGGTRIFSNLAATSGVLLAPGASVWSMVSDANAKENVVPVDGREVLERLADVPIATWNYTTQDDSVRHMGPMAQDFHAAFGLGLGDTTIDTIDPQGVALASIQGLHDVVEELRGELATKDQAILELHTRIGRLEASSLPSR